LAFPRLSGIISNIFCIFLSLNFSLTNDLLHYGSGTARGCGWQKIGAFVNLGSYYLVGIPAAIVFAFVLHIGGKVKINGPFFHETRYHKIWFNLLINKYL